MERTQEWCVQTDICSSVMIEKISMAESVNSGRTCDREHSESFTFFFKGVPEICPEVSPGSICL